MVKYSSIIIIILLFLIGCKKDLLKPECNGETPTYDNGIKTIIDDNCATSGCHDSGNHHGDFTSYSKMNDVINNGDFNQEVLIDQSMPRGETLTQEEINTIQCWVDNGYPEN